MMWFFINEIWNMIVTLPTASNISIEIQPLLNSQTHIIGGLISSILLFSSIYWSIQNIYALIYVTLSSVYFQVDYFIRGWFRFGLYHDVHSDRFPIWLRYTGVLKCLFNVIRRDQSKFETGKISDGQKSSFICEIPFHVQK